MNRILLFLVLSVFAISLYAQKKTYKVSCIAFYNLENLFDTIDNPNKNDEQFLPNGDYHWNSEKYLGKLDHMAEVITQIGDEYVTGGPAVIGVSEAENIEVLEDLCATPLMAASGYVPVLVEGPDLRGVDVGLLYRKDLFTLLSVSSHKLTVDGYDDFYTRDQLLVSGILAGDTLHFIVNHWPSRRGGEKRSAPLREAAAKLSRSIVDSILTVNPNAKIFVMGDLNDNPSDASVKKHLNAAGNEKDVAITKLFNPMYNMYKKDGLGSNAYRDQWSLFDQIIISDGLLGNDKSTFKMYQTKIFNRNFLLQKEGSFSGYPLRTLVGTNYMGGYSDHFPVYMFLIKEK